MAGSRHGRRFRHGGRASWVAPLPTAASRSLDFGRGRCPLYPQATAGADAVGLRARRADHLDADAARGPDAAAGGPDRISTSAARTSSSSPAFREGMHNVLRDLQESPLGKKANQLESMTIEMVAMLFDFIFETKDLPDGIKALLARLQIPVLKAAMLDGAFFAKKSHPSRLLVNALAEAGLGWSPVMGHGRSAVQPDRRASSTGSSTASPTTSRSSTSCARSSRRSSPRRRRRPKPTSSRPPRRSTSSDRQRDRGRSSPRPRSSGASRCIRSRTSSPSFLRQHWHRHARARLSHARRGKRDRGSRRRHARGPRVERAAQAHARRTASIWSRCCRRC